MGAIKIWSSTQKFAFFWHRPHADVRTKTMKTKLDIWGCPHIFWMVLPQQCNGPIINKLYCHFYAHYREVWNKLGAVFIWLQGKMPNAIGCFCLHNFWEISSEKTFGSAELAVHANSNSFCLSPPRDIGSIKTQVQHSSSIQMSNEPYFQSWMCLGDPHPESLPDNSNCSIFHFGRLNI